MAVADALFYGSGTALVTPFSDGKPDYDAWEKLIEYQLEGGSDAIIVLGTTGEAPTVNFSERCTLVEAAVKIAGGKLPVIVSVGTNCTKMSVELAAAAREQGADGILLSAPYYNRPTPPGIKEHFYAVSDAAAIPVIAYNVPSRTGINITPEIMGELAKHPMIRGLKEASSDAGHIAEMTTRFSDGIAIYAGNDSQILSIMAQGGRGAISVIGNAFPKTVRDITHAMLNCELPAAWSINAKIAPLISAMNMETNPGPIKYIMEKLGLCNAEMRLPMHAVSEGTKTAIDDRMNEYPA